MTALKKKPPDKPASKPITKPAIPELIGIGQFIFRGGTSWWPKIASLLAVVYLFVPTDVLADVIPILGQVDDAMLMGLALWWLSYATKRYNIGLIEAAGDSPKLEGGKKHIIVTKGEEAKKAPPKPKTEPENDAEERISTPPPPPPPDFFKD